MNNFHKLDNKIKHYEWGSAQILPQFLNIDNNEGLPFAELWMGTHKGGSSKIQINDSGEKKIAHLSELSGDLPFLFKLLAVEKPLSIQAHPNKEQAEEGYKREDASGLSINAPSRNYKDDNHKPEIICALTPFTMMAGFREPEMIVRYIEAFLISAPQLIDIIQPLIKALETEQLAGFFRTLFNFSEYQQEYLCSFINGKDNNLSDGLITNEQWNLMKYFCSLYPRDPAILSPLYLNYLELQPGQAVYIPAGILHAYLKGFGVELMSNSDNVLRGGLTPKHVDVNELLKILFFVPFKPQLITPPDAAAHYRYHTPCAEFELVFVCGKGGREQIKLNTPAICIVTEGGLELNDAIIKKGESFFIPKDAAPIFFGGNYKLYAACSQSSSG